MKLVYIRLASGSRSPASPADFTALTISSMLHRAVFVDVAARALGHGAGAEGDADVLHELVDGDDHVGVAVAAARRQHRTAGRTGADVRGLERVIRSERRAGRAGVAAAVAAPGAVERAPALAALVHVRAELEELRVRRQLEDVADLLRVERRDVHVEDLVGGEDLWSGKSCSSGGAK